MQKSIAGLNSVMRTYSKLIYSLAYSRTQNHADAEDIFQEVFLRLAQRAEPFQSEEHCKAWLIRVTVNACKDLVKSFFRSHTVSLEEIGDYAPEATREQLSVMEAVRSLPKQYRDVIYLHYYEGYTAPEIAGILKRNPNTVYTHLHKGKELLREALGGVMNG